MTKNNTPNDTLTFVSQAKNIHEAILEVMHQVEYVQKKKSPNLNYTFVGEADLIAALRPHMVTASIYCYVLGIVDWKVELYESKGGSRMVNTTLQSIVRFVHAPSNTLIDVAARGEGADSGDKSSNKAQTGAYKYALRQTFCLETGDDPDKDPSVERTGGNKAGLKSAIGVTHPNTGVQKQVAEPAVENKAPEEQKTQVRPPNGGSDLKITEIVLKDGTTKVKLSTDPWSAYMALCNHALTLTNKENKRVINGVVIGQIHQKHIENPVEAIKAAIAHVKELSGEDIGPLAREIYAAQSHLS